MKASWSRIHVVAMALASQLLSTQGAIAKRRATARAGLKKLIKAVRGKPRLAVAARTLCAFTLAHPS